MKVSWKKETHANHWENQDHYRNFIRLGLTEKGSCDLACFEVSLRDAFSLYHDSCKLITGSSTPGAPAPSPPPMSGLWVGLLRAPKGIYDETCREWPGWLACKVWFIKYQEHQPEAHLPPWFPWRWRSHPGTQYGPCLLLTCCNLLPLRCALC